jgi:hypothetical protein
MTEQNWEVMLNAEGPKEVILEVKGVKIPIKVRDLSWTEKNQILSKSFTYQSDGNISFDFDKYNKLVLTKIIIEAPWGKTDFTFLTQLPRSSGEILEKLVPKAFEDQSVASDFLGKELSK